MDIRENLERAVYLDSKIKNLQSTNRQIESGIKALESADVVDDIGMYVNEKNSMNELVGTTLIDNKNKLMEMQNEKDGIFSRLRSDSNVPYDKWIRVNDSAVMFGSKYNDIKLASWSLVEEDRNRKLAEQRKKERNEKISLFFSKVGTVASYVTIACLSVLALSFVITAVSFVPYILLTQSPLGLWGIPLGILIDLAILGLFILDN